MMTPVSAGAHFGQRHSRPLTPEQDAKVKAFQAKTALAKTVGATSVFAPGKSLDDIPKTPLQTFYHPDHGFYQAAPRTDEVAKPSLIKGFMNAITGLFTKQ